MKHERLGRSYASALRMYVGAGRRISINALSKKTKLARATIRGYLRDDGRPSDDNHEKMVAVLGDDFRALVNLEKGYATVPLSAAEPCARTLHVENLSVAQEMAQRLSDGVFCHRDKAAMAPKLASLGVNLLTMARG